MKLWSCKWTGSRVTIHGITVQIVISYPEKQQFAPLVDQYQLSHPSLGFRGIYPGPGGGGTSLSGNTQTSFFPATSSISSGDGGIPGLFGFV